MPEGGKKTCTKFENGCLGFTTEDEMSEICEETRAAVLVKSSEIRVLPQRSMPDNFPVVCYYFVATWCRLGLWNFLEFANDFDSGLVGKERSVMYLGLNDVKERYGSFK